MVNLEHIYHLMLGRRWRHLLHTGSRSRCHLSKFIRGDVTHYPFLIHLITNHPNHPISKLCVTTSVSNFEVYLLDIHQTRNTMFTLPPWTMTAFVNPTKRKSQHQIVKMMSLTSYKRERYVCSLSLSLSLLSQMDACVWLNSISWPGKFALLWLILLDSGCPSLSMTQDCSMCQTAKFLGTDIDLVFGHQVVISCINLFF